MDWYADKINQSIKYLAFENVLWGNKKSDGIFFRRIDLYLLFRYFDWKKVG